MPADRENEDQEALLAEDTGDISLAEKASGAKPWASTNHLRMILELVMALLIVALSILYFSERNTGRSSPIPKCLSPLPS